MEFRWYFRRLRSMSPAELARRTADAGRRRLWARRPPAAPAQSVENPQGPRVPAGMLDLVTAADREQLIAAADGLLEGHWSMFGRTRTDMTAEIDWFADFVNKRRAPDTAFSLGIDHRDEAAVGNIKFVWEAARHQHLSVLAAAYAVSNNEAYAQRIDAELRRYWQLNPFLVGIHWTSGIELGIRMMSWVWIRRLLDAWDGAANLFEANPTFVEQLGRHHQWIEALGSHGSSANNHLIAEAAGQFVAATAFPFFESSATWQSQAGEELARELEAQTFADGLNKELASDYHGFVLELALIPWVEAALTGHDLADRLAAPLARAFDALHAVVDSRRLPHRQADSDDAHGLLLDPPGYQRWASLLSSASLVAEPLPWWVGAEASSSSGSLASGSSDVRTAILKGSVAAATDWEPIAVAGRREKRPGLFPDAGLSVMRSTDLDPADEGSKDLEVWCAMDHGPHGYLSTAAHAHADALAIELRVDGVEVIVDPGTYCYHGERTWRDYFRSTAAHATIELNGTNQSEIGGPFLWMRRATATLEAHGGLDGGAVAMVRASHDGYSQFGYLHRRELRLDRASRMVRIIDTLDSVGIEIRAGGSETCEIRQSFPLGPDIDVELDPGAAAADLSWNGAAATLQLDPGLTWRVERGVEAPPSGWYSAHFGLKVPTPVLVGLGKTNSGQRLVTTISIRSTAPEPEPRKI